MPSAARVVTELEVDASKAIASLNSYDAATGKAATGTLRLVESGRGLERQLDRVRAAADPAVATAQKVERAQTTVDAAFKRGLISQGEASRTISQLRDHYSIAGHEAETFGSRIRHAGESVKEYGESISKYTVAFGLGSVALFGGPELISKMRETVRSLHELADAASKAGISSEKLQVLRYSFEQSAGTAAEADAAMVRFNKTIGELALTGTGPGKEAMQALGISVRDAGGHARTTGAIFDDVVKRLGRVADQNQVAAVASRLFGKEAGPALASTLMNGADALQNTEDHLKSLGGIMDEISLKQAEELDKKFSDLSVTVEHFAEKSLLKVAEGFAKQEESIRAFVDSPSLRKFLQIFGQDEQHLNLFAPPTPSDRISEAFDNLGTPDQTLQNALRRKVQGTITLPDLANQPSIDSLNKQNEALSNFIDTIRAQGEEIGKSDLQIKIDSDLRKLNELDINSQTDGMAAYIEALDRQADAQKQAISHMDDLRDSAKGFLDTIATGGDVVDFFKKKLLDLGETQLTNALLGKPGEGGGGLFGDAFGNLFGMGSSPAPQSVTSKIGYGIPIPWAGGVTSRDLPPLPGGAPNGMVAIGAGLSAPAWSQVASNSGILGLIRQNEGTAGPNGYNTTLGNGMFLPGGREQNLSGMTVDQVNRLGFGILHNPDNKYGAGPMGAYQITPTTMMDLRKSMHLSGDELFDKPMQDSMALELMKERGTSTDALRGTWASLNKVDPAQIQSALTQSSHQITTSLKSVATTTEQAANSFAPVFPSALKQVTQTAQTGAGDFSVFPNTLDAILKSLGGGGGLSSEALGAIAGAGGGGLFSRVGPPPGGGRGGGGTGGHGGGGVTINQATHNYAGGDVQTETRASRGAGGEINIDTIVKRVTKHVGETYGLRQPVVGRA